MSFDEKACGSMQVARAAVIAQPFPQAQHLLFTRLGQGAKGRKRREKAVEIGYDGRDLRLLKHDLADPDGIGIASVPPGKVALMAGKPV